MLYVTLALVAALVAATFAYTATIRSLVRQQARERDLLINQMCSLAGSPWQPAPAAATFHEEPERDLSLVSPDQWPEDEL